MRRRREVQPKVCLPDLSKIDRSRFLQAVRDVHVLQILLHFRLQQIRDFVVLPGDVSSNVHNPSVRPQFKCDHRVIAGEESRSGVVV
jgi:hypothetical protein